MALFDPLSGIRLGCCLLLSADRSGMLLAIPLTVLFSYVSELCSVFA